MQLTLVRQAVVALSLGAARAAASALPSVTFNPAASGLAGTSFTADNILISDYSTVQLNGATFTETGLLSVSAYQLGGSTFAPSGLNSTYGMYIAFNGTGIVTNANPASAVTVGSFTQLTYTLYGYNGAATFGFSGNTPTVTTGSSPLLLA